MADNKTASDTAYFSGPVAQHYEKYQGPVFFEPYALEVAGRVDAAAVKLALEIACGTGRVTRQLRKALSPGAKLIATDLSADMLQVAKEELKGLPIEWQVADANNLPFDSNTFDLVVCCFGYMFAPDKVKAFREAFRVLRTGGTLLFTAWDELEYNGASQIHRQTVKKFLGEALPPSLNTAFSMTNVDEIKTQLTLAGFNEITIEHVEKTALSSSAKFVAEGLSFGGSIFNFISAHNPGAIPKIKAEIEKQLIEKYGDAPMKAPMRAILATARKK